MSAMEVSPIEFDYTQPTNQQWKRILEQNLQAAKSFEIHCWTGETEWIDVALQYGEIKKTGWRNGKVITGIVTPFFSIFLDNGFSSEHYGSE